MVVRDALLMASWGETMGLLYNVMCKIMCALCDMCYLYPLGRTVYCFVVLCIIYWVGWAYVPHGNASGQL